MSSGDLAYVSAYYDQFGDSHGMTRGRLVAFNLATNSVAWNVGTAVRSNPVLAAGVVYTVMTGGTLQAHDAASGSLQWSWSPPASDFVPGATWGPDVPLVVVGSHAFVGLERGITYAIDLNTRQAVWNYPAVGPMAVSPNGTLFIAQRGRLHAINLR